jgi:site-specific DNA-methyltransferase (adenine-specific)
MRCYENISIFYQGKTLFNKQETRSRDKTAGKRKESTKVYPNSRITVHDMAPIHISKIDGQIRRTTINPRNLIEFDVVPRNKVKHPTQKPAPLLEYLIKTYTNENDVVLDNVMGSGSTGVACLNTNRKFIGIEKDEKYYKIAEQRILNINVIDWLG